MAEATNEPSTDRGAELMLAWQNGDESAFETLVAEFSGAVWSLLTRFLGPREGREDLVQEVFLRVIRARDRYAPSARFTTWLYRIVFNLAVNETERARESVSIDAMRSGAARSASDHAPGTLAAYDPVDESAPRPDGGLERQDLVAHVRRAIAGLPETQRMALVLAKYEELSQTEIAEVLGTTTKAVKSLIHRARENLRAALIPIIEEEVA